MSIEILPLNPFSMSKSKDFFPKIPTKSYKIKFSNKSFTGKPTPAGFALEETEKISPTDKSFHPDPDNNNFKVLSWSYKLILKDLK